MPLLDEGTPVWRPVKAQALVDETYRILGSMPDYEVWAFPPGGIIVSRPHVFADGDEGPVAMSIV